MGRPKGSKNKPKVPTAKGFVEVAQELVTYSVTNGNNPYVQLEVTLPQSVIDSVSNSLGVVLDARVDTNNDTTTLNLTGGTVVLKPTVVTTEQVA